MLINTHLMSVRNMSIRCTLFLLIILGMILGAPAVIPLD